MRSSTPHTIRRAIQTLLAITAAFTLFVFSTSPASADEGPRIHLIHGIPDTNVDVEAGGENVFEDFAFGDTQDLSGLAGETLADLKVKLAGTDTVAIDAGDVELPSSGNYTVLAHLDGNGDPALAVFQNDATVIRPAQGRLTVRHAAAAPNVDILAEGNAAFTNVANGEGGTVDLDVGTISASVVPTGETEPVVIGPADLAIKDGEHLLVYAVGSLEGDSLTVITESITGLHSTPDEVNSGNSLPESGSSTATIMLGLIGLAAAASVVSLTIAGRRAGHRAPTA